MRADQRRRRQVETQKVAVVAEAGGGRRDLPFAAHAEERRCKFARLVGDHPGAHLALTADHRRHRVLQDASLLGCDPLKLVAEEAGVVVTDWRDGGERRRDHVGRIQAAAHADLDHGEISRHAGKSKKGRDRGDLEEGDGLFLIGLLTLRQDIVEHVVLDQAAGDANALVEAHQMRRGVDVHAIARSLGHGAQVGDQRALAVGAGDMDHRR